MVVKSVRQSEKQPVSVWSDLVKVDVAGRRKHNGVHAVPVVMQINYLYRLIRRSAGQQPGFLRISQRIPFLDRVSDIVLLYHHLEILRDEPVHRVSYLVKIGRCQLCAALFINIAVITLIERISYRYVHISQNGFCRFQIDEYGRVVVRALIGKCPDLEIVIHVFSPAFRL